MNERKNIIPQKRVLVVCQHFYPENFRINDICTSLIGNEIDVDVMCGIPNYPKGRFFEGYSYFSPRRETYNGVNVMRAGEIPQLKGGGKLFVALNYLWFPLASLFHVPKLMCKKKYDCVFLYATSPVFMAFPGLVYAKLRNTRTVLYVLDYWPDSLYSVIPIKNRFLRAIFRRVSFWHYRHADTIITVSNGMLKKMREEAGIPEDKSYFLPQSCEKLYETTTYDEELHERFGGKFNIIFAGNIGPAQSLETLVEAAVKLEKTGESLPDYRFILIGDGMSRKTLNELVTGKQMNHRFIFEGYVSPEQVLKYYELADVLYVSLSSDELFKIMLPSKIQSYMAAGKPILASLSGEGRDTILQAECGLACESGDANALADTIVQILSMPRTMLSRFGENGKKYYEQNYKHEIFMDRIMDYLSMKG